MLPLDVTAEKVRKATSKAARRRFNPLGRPALSPRKTIRRTRRGTGASIVSAGEWTFDRGKQFSDNNMHRELLKSLRWWLAASW